MRSLPVYAKSLLLQGANVTGSFTEGYYFVEEQLKIKDSDKLLKFCKWIDENIGGASRTNIEILFLAFNNPKNAHAAEEAQKIAGKIRYIKSL
jgi:hypothetical protein